MNYEKLQPVITRANDTVDEVFTGFIDRRYFSQISVVTNRRRIQSLALRPPCAIET